jgi:putative transposase
MRFRLVDAAKKDFPVAHLCKILDVSPSGYFAWKSRPASTRQREDLVLLAHVRSAFTLSHETYGSPRMTHELREQGLAAGRRRVARLMRENGLKARQPRRFQCVVADDILDLGGESGIARALERAQTMRLEAVSVLDPLHGP